MDIEIDDVAALGVIRDQPPYQLVPEAWSYGENVRYRDGGVEGLGGWTEVFTGTHIAPYFLMPVRTSSLVFWIYTSLTAAASYDGTTHSDITRAVGGAYTATAAQDWNGTILGGVVILNNGSDLPQFTLPAATVPLLANLTNWPAGYRAKIVRSLGNYLVAFNITKAGVNYPHLVLWSHPADPGTVPSSWDVTNPAVDAGENDLSDVNSGIILDALPLGSAMFIYKESSIWRMSYIGGRFVFDFKTFAEGSGILAPRCVCLTPDGTRHVVVTQDDIVWHNGNGQPTSILTKRQKKYLFDNLDSDNYATAFLAPHPEFNEIWFHYPTQGAAVPNSILIWNYKENSVGPLSEASGTSFQNMVPGPIEVPSDEAWDDGDDEWDADTGPWAQLQRRKTVAVDPVAGKFYALDVGTTRGGTTFTSTLRREALAMVGKKRNGEWIVDFKQKKLLRGIWPKLQGPSMQVRVGSQQTPEGATTWGSYKSFDPSTDIWVDTIEDGAAEGRAISVEFFCPTGAGWRLDGYKVDLTLLGQF